ncbi:hypothetical protein ACF1FY_36190 [Streptomyces althioticus]|uniref:hypothetical protein n=1 Tax=Streptomyces althioticus TaxID=83380 RepID=UPI0036F5BDB0
MNPLKMWPLKRLFYYEHRPENCPHTRYKVTAHFWGDGPNSRVSYLHEYRHCKQCGSDLSEVLDSEYTGQDM